MLGRILLCVILIPLVELVLLKELHQRTSLLTTVIVVLITGIVGVNLARRQGLQVWHNIHKQTAAGKVPSQEILDAVMILLAGAFLITPGLLTDGVGFSLLVPAVRRRLGSYLAEWFRRKTVTTFQSTTFTSNGFPADDSSFEEAPSVRVVVPPEDDDHLDTPPTLN
ncbi:MAG: FxsA family protein [Fuerstiella sp.]|nr:FxsA family protein [Fuerstiella sp.]